MSDHTDVAMKRIHCLMADGIIPRFQIGDRVEVSERFEHRGDWRGAHMVIVGVHLDSQATGFTYTTTDIDPTAWCIFDVPLGTTDGWRASDLQIAFRRIEQGGN